MYRTLIWRLGGTAEDMALIVCHVSEEGIYDKPI